MTKKTINVLWTGGWDSTYRIVQLSREDCIIQPVYIINKRRESLKEEQRAINEIYSLLKEKKETIAVLLPVKELVRQDFVIPKEITNSYNNILKTRKIGSQYEWLAYASRLIDDLEISFEKSEKPGATDLLIESAKFDVIEDENPVMACYRLSDDNDLDVLNIFGRLNFPINIYNRTKQDFLEDFKKWDCLDIAEKTWFCSQPINGKPCGYCSPCRDVINEGLEFRMPEESMKRYKNRYFWLIKYKIRKTFLQLIGKWN